MKEQTPIEELNKDIQTAENIPQYVKEGINTLVKVKYLEREKEHTQAKLEERDKLWCERMKVEVLKAYQSGCFKAITDLTVFNKGAYLIANEYYETEVKPRIVKSI